MKSEIKPTIGRVVIYVWPEGEIRQDNNFQPTSPAIITNALDDYGYENSEVNLKVISDNEKNVWSTSVPYDATGQTPRSWHWPPRG